MPAENVLLLSGNEAVARGSWEAGVRVACSYPGTPATEVVESLAGYGEVDCQWSVNEKVAYEVALGAAIGGARSLYASKHVGLNAAMDPFMTSSYTGLKAGMVVVVADDPGMHSSQNEQDTRWAARFAKVPLLEPANPGEAHEFVKTAFELGEEFDTPVLLRSCTRVSHTKESVRVGERAERPVGAYRTDPQKYLMLPSIARKRHLAVEERLGRLAAWAEHSPVTRTELRDRAQGFIVSGVVYHYVRELFPDASVLKLGMPWPLPMEAVRAFCDAVTDVMVVEELEPFLEQELAAEGLRVRAKHPSFRTGELLPEMIPDLVAGKQRVVEEHPDHPPQLCKGCGYRVVFGALRDMDVIVAGDIGCYTLGALEPFKALHMNLCMGAGVTLAEGLRRARFEGRERVVSVIGDSTFIHSGITGLINGVYNGIDGLLVILDNETTAMTGGQAHPGSGHTADGSRAPRQSIENICRACGAASVDVISPEKTAEVKSLLEKRLAEPGLAVVIARSPCSLFRDNG